MSAAATISITDRIATITMDDGKANAFGFDMMAAIKACLDEAENAADVIILTGRPGIMCAGFDLKVMKNAPEDATEMVRLGGDLLLRLFGSKQPIIIAATGHGIAAGGLLMLSADYRIAAAGDARFGLNETAIGMVLPPFGMDMARFKLNNQFLDAAVVGATLYSPEEAVTVGYVDQVVAADKVMDCALEKATAIQQLDLTAYAGNK
jgi:enoyl-CoA hydratase